MYSYKFDTDSSIMDTCSKRDHCELRRRLLCYNAGGTYEKEAIECDKPIHEHN
jgi:hypothetical protein